MNIIGGYGILSWFFRRFYKFQTLEIEVEVNIILQKNYLLFD
jgi:hypothetical protein